MTDVANEEDSAGEEDTSQHAAVGEAARTEVTGDSNNTTEKYKHTEKHLQPQIRFLFCVKH